MLQFFQSNNLSALANAFCERSQLDDTDPFTPSTVIVQSVGTGQWLKLQLASRQGISANLDCVLPAHFIWGLYRSLLGQAKQSPLDKDLLTWRLMSILPEQDAPEFESIRSYLNTPGDRDLRTFQLAGKIAGLFDQYLVYRPEWILAWEDRKDLIEANPHPWQPRLWRTLMQENPELKEQHRARLHQRLLQRLEKPGAPGLLPQRISLFGLSSLPLIQLDTFRALSAHIDVDIYFMNPCRHYWGDIVSKKDLAKRSVRELIAKTGPLEEEDYLEVGNPLLASFGKMGREFLELILETDGVNAFDAFVERSNDTALGFLQNDILNLEFGGQFGSEPPGKVRLNEEDRSIQVHSCHSKLREIEILYDQLLLIFNANSQITPADIIVMTPNVADYTPFIHSVFKNKIHYGIADRSLIQQSALVGSFSKLLELQDSRLTSVDIMDFLEVPAIARKFKLGEEELNTISYWISGTGIRWEMDGPAKSKRWQVPENHQNTWRFGLDRLLLGMTMDSSNGIFEGDYPFDLESGDAELLGTLCQIVQLIDDFRQQLATPKTASAWQTAINTLLTELFIPLDEEALDLSMIQTLLQKLVDDTRSCGIEGDLSGQLVRYWINQQLAVTQSSMGFISGGITFATLVPMRSIPFKVVCLLGMNDREYPREDHPFSLDLMPIAGARKGDRSRRADDRYLFLEAMLSARDIFYISYEGRALKNNQEKPPSVVVSELVDYTSQVFDSINTVIHPLQPFSRRYFQGKDLTSFQKHWYDALQKSAPPENASPDKEQTHPFIDGDLETPVELELESIGQLVAFFRHSGKFFLQQRLGIYFENNEVDLQESESFTLDNLERYQLSDSALQALVKGEDIRGWQDEMVASGFVMDSPSGKVYLQRELQNAQNIYRSIEGFLAQAGGKFQGSISLSGSTVQGHIDHVGDSFILNYRCGELRKKHLLEIWINHLFASAAGQNKETISISRGKTSGGKDSAETNRMRPVSRTDAIAYLEQLADLYRQGLVSPLCFPPEAAFSFFETLQKSDDAAVARDAATRKWNSSDYSEDKDIYWSRLFALPQDLDATFAARAQQVYGTLLPYWEKR